MIFEMVPLVILKPGVIIMHGITKKMHCAQMISDLE